MEIWNIRLDNDQIKGGGQWEFWEVNPPDMYTEVLHWESNTQHSSVWRAPFDEDLMKKKSYDIPRHSDEQIVGRGYPFLFTVRPNRCRLTIDQ